MTGGAQRGAQIAIGILLLWFGGTMLFIAFMSGKADSLTIGASRDGKRQGPRDASELVTRLADAVQTASAPPQFEEGS